MRQNTKINIVFSAILLGSRTAKEINSLTGVRLGICYALLAKLEKSKLIKKTGYLLYPCEKLSVSFYEPNKNIK